MGSKSNENRVLFFCGDVIPTPYPRWTVKQQGILLTHLLTLKPYQGLLERNTFTLLMPAKQVDNAWMLPPDAQGWRKMPNKPRQCESAFATSSDSDNRVYKWRLPKDDVKRAIQPSLPNGGDGVVEITSLQGATKREVARVQKHFFSKGYTGSLLQWESYIQDRMTGEFESIGIEMLESHARFSKWRDNYIKKAHIDTIAFLDRSHWLPAEYGLRDALAVYRTLRSL